MNIVERYGLPSKEKYQKRENFFAGVECEIESLLDIDQQFPNFMNKEDHSLRNNGREFISVPLNRIDLETSFKTLHSTIAYRNKGDAFSPRTSTHVHVNCHGLSMEEVKQLILLYALFEELFFSMVSADRRNNIHCVPLSETMLPQSYNKPLESLVSIWQKYTALNILPLKSQGTVEFRHLHGTNDVELFHQWLTYLENIFTLSKTSPINADSLVNREHIRQWYNFIFKEMPKKEMYDPILFNIIQRSVVDVKFAFA